LPAIKELSEKTKGDEAGRVFHELASFCDKQLQNPDDLEDFLRVERLRDSKEQEVLDLERMIKSATGSKKDTLKHHRSKTKTWFDLDDREYQRLKRSREAFLRQSLENYLLSMSICDNYNNDVLRFCALWLDQSEDEAANESVGKHIKQVASRKFVPLMNQLSSRLLSDSNSFQSLLHPLLLRICLEHPYHGMYQMFFTSKSKGQDKTAISRFEAARKIVDGIRRTKAFEEVWVPIHNSCVSYSKFATERLDEQKFKPGSKARLSKLESGVKLEQNARNQKVPPATMRIPVRVDCNYDSVPRLAALKPDFTIAGGVSAPKIVTAIATDGLEYKQLVSQVPFI
jgi:serine-protein kinase ATM